MALITVTTLNDNVNLLDGLTSLREAIFIASLLAGADRIELAAGLGGGGAVTIDLALGELVITQAGGPLTIDGDRNNDGVADLTLDANQDSRVLRIAGAVDDLAEVTLEGLVITEGLVQAVNGEVAGGGILATEVELTLTDVSVVSNQVRSGSYDNYGTADGGGIAVRGGSLTASGLTIVGNSATGFGLARGGGLDAQDSALSLTGTQLYGNTVDGSTGFAGASFGGGLAIRGGSLTFSGTIASNQASSGSITQDGVGGGLAANGADVTVTASLIIANSADLGAACVSKVAS